MKKYLIIGSFRHWDGFIHVYGTLDTKLEVGSEGFQTQVLTTIFELTKGDEFFEDKEWDEGDSPDIEFYEIVGGKKQFSEDYDESFLNIADPDYQERLKASIEFNKAERKRRKERFEANEKEEFKRLQEKFKNVET